MVLTVDDGSAGNNDQHGVIVGAVSVAACVSACVDGDGDNVCDDTDCDDTNDEVYPGAEEICDGLDSNCDGSIPACESDDDGDGTPNCGDSLWLHPGATHPHSPNSAAAWGMAEFGARLAAEGITKYDELDYVGADLGAAVAGHDLVVLDIYNGVGGLTDAQAADLYGYVAAGGTLLVLTGGSSDATACTALDVLDSRFGVGCSNPATLADTTTTVVAGHPLTSGLTVAGVQPGIPATMTVSSPATTLIRGSVPLLAAGSIGAGRFAALADEWPLINAGTGPNDISFGDYAQLADNIAAWVAAASCQAICVDSDGDGETTCNGDCDDSDAAVNTSATESLWNGVDDDCNPATEDAPNTTWDVAADWSYPTQSG